MGYLNVGKKITAIRGSKTRLEFIRDNGLDMAEQYLYQIESGKRPAPQKFLQKLCNLFNVPMSFFLDENIEELKCLPNELSDVGIEYVFVAHEAQQAGFTADELRKLVEMAKFMKQSPG